MNTVPPRPDREISPLPWRTWLLVGATGFGGPAAQIALLHRELVDRHRALEEEDFLAAMRVCMLLPGPEAQQLATYAGWRLGGWRHGLLAGGMFVLPGAMLVTALAALHAAGERIPLVSEAFAGTRPAVVALVASAAWRIGRRTIGSRLLAGIALAALVALACGCPFPLAMLSAAAIGFVSPLRLAAASSPAENAPPDSAPGDPARKTRREGTARHAIAVLATAAGLWLASDAALRWMPAAPKRGREIAALFTETTLLSFGGAYAVVPWALDESVTRGWIEPAERFDALAMGEATPGPLILVVTFLGYLAADRESDGDGPTAGPAGAAIATWFAFLPSFAMILAIAPFVGRIRASPRTGNALAAVGGVIVAAIVLLGLRLAAAVLWKAGGPDPVALLAAIAAGAALQAGRMPAPAVVAAAAGFGLLRPLAG